MVVYVCVRVCVYVCVDGVLVMVVHDSVKAADVGGHEVWVAPVGTVVVHGDDSSSGKYPYIGARLLPL